MGNKYIKVVKKWRAGEAVSQQELDANADAAYAAVNAVNADAATTAANAAAADAANEAAAAYAYDAVNAARAAYEATANADYWVKRYEELTKDYEVIGTSSATSTTTGE